MKLDQRLSEMCRHSAKARVVRQARFTFHEMEIVHQSCAGMGVHIVKGVLARVHVHMFLSVSPRPAISMVLQRTKGRRSRRIQM